MMAIIGLKYHRSNLLRRLSLSRKLIGLVLGCFACFSMCHATAEENFFADTLTKSVIYYHVKNGLGETIDNDNIGKIFLVNPDSVYSELNAKPTIINSIQWNLALGKFNRDNRVNLTLDDSIRLFASENGLTKARPDVEVDMSRQPSGYRQDESRLIVANATKARVDGDIFYQSQFIFARTTTIAAKFAVAAQILRDQARRVPPAEHGVNGIRKDVLDRYLSSATHSTNSISDYDRNYLMGLLHNQFRSTEYQSADFKNGNFVPPAQFRVARIAAAFRDRQGYPGNVPCLADGNNLEPEGSGTLCFTNMTDKALFSWYKKEYAWQMAPHVPSDSGSFMEKLSKILLPISMLLDALGAVEFMAALETSELAAEEALTEEEAVASESRYLDRYCRL